jgi:hypothetical protein
VSAGLLVVDTGDGGAGASDDAFEAAIVSLFALFGTYWQCCSFDAFFFHVTPFERTRNLTTICAIAVRVTTNYSRCRRAIGRGIASD